MKMIYDEWYGNISFAQRSAYRKFNVSPSDHTMLAEQFGETNHAKITQVVKDRSTTGYYRAPLGW